LSAKARPQRALPCGDNTPVGLQGSPIAPGAFGWQKSGQLLLKFPAKCQLRRAAKNDEQPNVE
jgi:hypothetical protein